MATIDCEITEKNDKHTQSDSSCGELRNGNIVINFDRSNSCQSDNDNGNGGKSDGQKENGGSRIGKSENCDEEKKENVSTKISSDLLSIPLPKNGHRMSFMEEESAKEKLRLTLLKQCFAILKQGDQWYTKESLHRTFQDLDLLERIFRLFDTENNERLVQNDWFEFLKQRLTDEKQKAFVEQVESVTYVLCGNDDITLDVFQKTLQNRVVTKVLFRALDTDCDGYITADDIMDFISAVSSSRPRVGFEKSSVDRLEQLFRRTVGDQKEITKEQFHKIMDKSNNPFFTERVFQIFDEDNSGAISLQEFIAAVHTFGGQAPDDKIRFLFKVYDMDNDGLIQRRELEHVMRVCMEESGMTFSNDQLSDLTDAFFEDADSQQRGAITYEALKKMLDKHGGLRENITICIDRWLVPPKVDQQQPSLLQRLSRLKPYFLSGTYVRNNYVFLAYLAAYFIVNLVLFVTRCIEYGSENIFTILARGCGQCLNFNCAWILVLMLRHSLTWARTRGAGALLPLDQHVYLHKLAGVVVAAFGLLHTLMHLCNFSIIVVNHPVINRQNFTLYEWLLTSTPGKYGLVGGWANPTGFALVAVLLVLFVCSQRFIRRGGRFKIFYWTHVLYVPFWVLLLLHGPNFYKWFVVPGTIYVCERIMRLMMSQINKTYISSAILLPSRVTHVIMRRPPHFTFHAGDYVFVNIPAIAAYEWHPFTISSAPELEGYLWLHVRGVGEWTNHLYRLFEEEQARLYAPPPAADNGTDQLTRNGSTKSTKSNKSKGSRFGSFKKVKKVSLELTPSEYRKMDEDDTTHLEDTPSPAKNVPEALSPQRFLEKSRSMPNVQKNAKKTILRDYFRSESEHFSRSPSPCNPFSPSPRCPGPPTSPSIPSHQELERRFRYMRNKPSIIAFKTPSYDDWDRRRSNESIITIARRRLSKSISPDKDPETPKDKASEMKEEGFNPEELSKHPIGKPLEIYIDGPYGAASSHIFESSHAVLIAAGIGVTPFACILQAIMYRYWAARRNCPNCGYCWRDDLSTNMKLNKVDFFWINREQRSFEWFVSLLSQLEMEQAELRAHEPHERFLEMHMYITSALQRTDMKAVALQLALDMLHEKEKRDLITGLKTRTNAGRPNWDKVFTQLTKQNKGHVTVFYCGPPQLGRVLKLKCNQYGFSFRKEVF